MTDPIAENIATHLQSAEPGHRGVWVFPLDRPTPADIHAMEHGGYHVPIASEDEAREYAEGARGPGPHPRASFHRPKPAADQRPDTILGEAHVDLETGHTATELWVEDVVVQRAHEALEAANAHLPGDPKPPLATGLFDFFPDALAAVALASVAGHHQRAHGDFHLDTSAAAYRDSANKLLRHFQKRGSVDTDGVPHMAKAAWRALAVLQMELEEAQP